MANPIANPIDRLRDRWDQMPPRERRLVTILVSTIVVAIAFYVALGIRDGLGDLEKANQQKRDALRAIQLYQAGGAAKAKAVEIPDEAVKLDRYVDGIIGKVGIESPRYPQPKDSKKGKYIERTFKLTLPQLTINQLKDFLEKLESESKVVWVKELHVKVNFREKDKLDVDLVVATLFSPGKGDGKGKGKDKGSDGEGEGS